MRRQRTRGGRVSFYGIWLIAAAALIVLPLIFSSGGSLTSFSLIGIAIVFALSYNILLGQTGLLSFGHAVQYGLGGFLAVHVMNAVASHNWPLPLPLIPLVGGVGGLAFAIIIGWVMTKRAGTVFAMISLGIGELVASSSLILRSVFGGEAGITTDRTALPHDVRLDLRAAASGLLSDRVLAMISAIAMYALTRTPLGRICNAVRDNPERVEFIGYDPHVVRYLAYGFCGFLRRRRRRPGGDQFRDRQLRLSRRDAVRPRAVRRLHRRHQPISSVPILGAILVTYLQLGLTDLTTVWQLYFGIIFIGIVMFAPGGIAGLLMMHRPLIRAGTLWHGDPVLSRRGRCRRWRSRSVSSSRSRRSRATPRARATAMSSTCWACRSMRRRRPTWLAAAVLVVGGFVRSRGSRGGAIAEAWDRAATVARDRGYLA